MDLVSPPDSATRWNFGWVRIRLTGSLPQSARDKALAETLVGSLLDSEDIAEAVTFLCGRGGRRITGQILRV